MGLKAGNLSYVSDNKYTWLDSPLADSLTKAMDDEMKALYKLLNAGKDLPDTGKSDRLLLFAAIARGLLRYLNKHETDIIKSITISHSSPGADTHQVSGLDLDITV